MNLSIKDILVRSIRDLGGLVYPRFCPGCDRRTPMPGEMFCLTCYANLPLTYYHLHPTNAVEQHFWGRFQFEAAASFLFFVPGGITQHLLHNIKYRNHRHFAVDIGTMYGMQLKVASRFSNIDGIIPIPLHWKKLRKRGFNQSREFALGLSNAMDVPLLSGCLTRNRATRTQTRKSRFDRIDNISGAFSLKNQQRLEGRHVLLVDDVITTGATIEAAALTLMHAPGIRISIASIACGRI